MHTMNLQQGIVNLSATLDIFQDLPTLNLLQGNAKSKQVYERN